MTDATQNPQTHAIPVVQLAREVRALRHELAAGAENVGDCILAVEAVLTAIDGARSDERASRGAG